MSARSLLVHRAIVMRERESDTPDGLGQPIMETITLHEAMPCRVWSEEARLVVSVDKVVNVGVHRILAPYGIDLQEKTDTIVGISDKRGNSLFGDISLRVDSIYNIPHKLLMADLESAK